MRDNSTIRACRPCDARTSNDSALQPVSLPVSRPRRFLSPRQHVPLLWRRLWSARHAWWLIPLLVVFLFTRACAEIAPASLGGSKLGAALHSLRYHANRPTWRNTYGPGSQQTLALQFFKVDGVWHDYSHYTLNPTEEQVTDVVWVTFEPTVQSWGLWSPVVGHFDEGITFDIRTRNRLAKPLSNEDKHALLKASLTHWQPPPSNSRRQKILSGNWQHTRVLWQGVANDAVVLVAFVWLGRLVVLHGRRLLFVHLAKLLKSRQHTRVIQGLCSHCEYPIKGLARCPECGNENRFLESQ